jgi:hypothetical protein
LFQGHNRTIWLLASFLVEWLNLLSCSLLDHDLHNSPFWLVELI